MRATGSMVIAALAVSMLGWSLSAFAADSHAADVAQGEYLVNRVGLCGDCHTPLGPDKKPDTSRALSGAALDFGPPQAGHPHACAPALAGLKWPDEVATKFFETGIDERGKLAPPPMPAYRFKREDAVAVTAYLKSLPPPASTPCHYGKHKAGTAAGG